jgi:polyphosphate kinase
VNCACWHSTAGYWHRLQDERIPLLERLRFLSIVSSNLDEFFEIRVSGLKEQIRSQMSLATIDGKTAQETFRLVAAETHAIVEEQYALLNEVILPALAQEGIRFLRRARQWNEAQREWIRNFSSAKWCRS